ncbi:ribbon-helix-helix protein, CopG family [Sphingomonas sp. ID0503]|uniref:ribbon-helix-helix protein, CopG family n=1 Tax=Sphingomonas sp. ID0503 TaxID=3399691 RepID=UPI003AFA900D
MTRILADLPNDDLRWLDQRAAELGRSRASVLREAVATYKAQSPANRLEGLEQGFGLWARQGSTADRHEDDRRRRAEWTRPWDAHYDEVRAESPECFTEDDDRARAHYIALTKGRTDPDASGGE